MSIHILFVCTANQCRSPMAEAIARAQLAQREIDARVSSRGVLPGGAEASASAVALMARGGLDLSEHVSGQLDGDVVASADLIVAMERRHLFAVAELDSISLHRAFVLTELARLAESIGERRGPESPREWLARADAARHASSVLAVDTSDDIADPFGGSRRAYRRCAEVLAERIETVLAALFP